MCLIQNWKWTAISVLIIIINCQAFEVEQLDQDVGEECTNAKGIVGFCQFKNNCPIETDLGVLCNAEKTIICCSKTISKNEHSNEQNNQSTESRFGFIPDFFNAPKPSQNPIQSINFFSNQKTKVPNLIGNVFHQNLNIMQFVEDRPPYQNFEQDAVIKPSKKKVTSTRTTNENDFYNGNYNQNSNIEDNFNRHQTTKKPQPNYYYSNYQTQTPNQNINNNQQFYETNQNNNNYYYNPSSVPARPIQNQNINSNQPYYETNPLNQNNNYNNNPSTVTQRPNQNNNKQQSSTSKKPNSYQHQNPNQPNYETYQSNQNNNNNRNTNYYTSTRKPQNNYNSGNNEHHSQTSNSQTNPNGLTNHRLPSSSITFPDDSNYDKHNTKFTTSTTIKYKENQNWSNENSKRISEIKCEEYSKPLTTTISALPLAIDSSPKPVSVEKCDSKGVGLIVGGAQAELGEFPHMVAIGFRANSGSPWNCGGTLISERFVLTAAHCIHSALGKPVQVRLGELNLKKNNDGANPVDLLVDEVFVHPDYVSTSKYNDIALIRMNKPVKFNNHIRPACLHNSNNIYAHKVTATGWGSIAYGDRSSDDLLKVDLDVINNKRCNKLYEAESKSSTLSRGIIDSMLCAGILEGGHDTCLGDSGGPLVIRSDKNTCIFNLIGITSFGKFCATENSPGVYTRVSTFLPWIEQIVWP